MRQRRAAGAIFAASAPAPIRHYYAFFSFSDIIILSLFRLIFFFDIILYFSILLFSSCRISPPLSAFHAADGHHFRFHFAFTPLMSFRLFSAFAASLI
jgi:hypothetical protein